MGLSSADWFDFLVIGSGTAGSVLAARLSEDAALRIGVIEAGGAATNPMIAAPAQWPLLQGSEIDWAYKTIPQRHCANRVHDWPRGRVIGGSTCINAMAHVRGHPQDFDDWRLQGWGFRDLLPYFIRSETYTPGASPWHGDSGPLHLIRPSEPSPVTQAYMQAGAEKGVTPTEDHNGRQLSGPCTNTLTIKAGKRQTIADAYLNPALGRENLQLLPETMVRALVFEGERCVGLEVSDKDGTRVLRAERGVILAAGAIATPLLLLRAGIGPAEDLRPLGIQARQDVPGVGRNLHDHLLSGGNVYRARKAVPPSKYQNSESLMYLTRGAPEDVPEMVLACVVAPVVTEQFTAPAFGEAYTIMFGFTHPKSRGAIRLASADPSAPPVIDPNYLAEASDREIYLEAMERAREIGHARALDEWRAEEVLPGPSLKSRADRLAFLEKAAFTHHHPTGTCRMGDDADAVVATDLKLRGLDGLYVCDASVLPAITTGPINAAIVAISERFSDLLRGKAPLAPMPMPA